MVTNEFTKTCIAAGVPPGIAKAALETIVDVEAALLKRDAWDEPQRETVMGSFYRSFDEIVNSADVLKSRLRERGITVNAEGWR